VSYSITSQLTSNYRFEQAREEIAQHLKGKKLVLIDRIATTGRNSYAKPAQIHQMHPEFIFSDYSYWGTIRPQFVFSSEEKYHVRYKNTNKDNINIDEALKLYLDQTQFIPVFSTWFATKEIVNISRKFNGIIAAVPIDVNTFLENKANFYSILTNSGVPKTHILKTATYLENTHLPDYRHFADKFGKIFVMQGRSIGGRGTRFIKTENDFQNAVNGLTGDIRIVTFCPGQTVAVNILTIPKGKQDCAIYVATPSHKSTNIPEIGVSEVFGAGNDWSHNFPKSLSSKFVDYVIQIGEYAYKKYGLCGIWGFDTIWQENNFYFIELNCRPQGSTETSAIDQITRGIPPFGVAHHSIFLNSPIHWLPFSDEFNHETIRRMSHSQEMAPFYLKIKAKENYPVRCKESVKGSGIYKLTPDDELEWLRVGMSTLEANFEEDEVLIANISLHNTVNYPTSQLCTLEGILRKRHIFDKPHRLSQYGRRLAKAIYRFFEPIE